MKTRQDDKNTEKNHSHMETVLEINSADRIEAQSTKEKQNELLSFSSVFKKISGLAIPMGLSFTFSFEVFLSVFLLHYLSTSDDEAAAATLVSVLMNSASIFWMSPLFAVAIHLSNLLGEWKSLQNKETVTIEELEQKKEIIASTNANSLLIASVVTVPTFFTLFFSKDLLVSIFHQSPAAASAAEAFLRPYSFAIPALMTRMSFEQIMFSFGKTKPAMWIALANLCAGGLLAGLLGFGLEIGSVSIPRLGPVGVALGFVAESFLTSILYGVYVGFNRELRIFNFFQNMLSRIKNNWDELKEILKLGSSITFTVAIELGLMLAIGIYSGLVGVKEQSAMTFNMQFIYFEFIALAAFSFSCAQEISRELGAKQFRNANQISKYGLLTTLTYLVPIPAFFAIFPKSLEFISGGASNEVSAMLKTLVPIMGVGTVFDIVRYNLLQQSRAYNDLLIPNIIAMFGMVGGIILAGALGLHTSLGIDGVGLGYMLGVAVAGTGLLINWLNKMSKVEYEANHTSSFSLSNSALSIFSKTKNKLLGKQNQTEKTALLDSQQVDQHIDTAECKAKCKK